MNDQDVSDFYKLFDMQLLFSFPKLVIQQFFILNKIDLILKLKFYACTPMQ